MHLKCVSLALDIKLIGQNMGLSCLALVQLRSHALLVGALVAAWFLFYFCRTMKKIVYEHKIKI